MSSIVVVLEGDHPKGNFNHRTMALCVAYALELGQKQTENEEKYEFKTFFGKHCQVVFGN